VTFIAWQPRWIEGDERWTVAPESDPGDVRGWFETEEEAMGYADSLRAWLASEPVPGDVSVSWHTPGDLDGILDRVAGIEPSDARIGWLASVRLSGRQAEAA
jgi:hypothetical protein